MGTADALRTVTMVVGGLSFGIGVMVAHDWSQRLDGYGKLAARLFAATHLLVVLFVWGVLAYRFGDPIWWQTPMALCIFSFKITVLLLVREIQLQERRRGEPPSRRAADRA